MNELGAALYGSLLGTAIGDAYGLPYEGMSPRRVKRLFWARRFAFIPVLHGAMISDDSEHAVMTVQAYIASGGDVDAFTHHLKRRLMIWLLLLPGGIGLATGRSLFKMWLGFNTTGVFQQVMAVLCVQQFWGCCVMICEL